jgi:hypothetical protein
MPQTPFFTLAYCKMSGLCYDYYNSGYILILRKLSTPIKSRGFFSADISRCRRVRYLYNPLEFDSIAISPTLFATFISLELLIEMCGLTMSSSIIRARLFFVILVPLTYLVNQI